MAPTSSGSRKQVLDLGPAGEARLEERLVRRVLQEPADQVRHPREHRPVGRIDPDPEPPGDQGPLDRLAHPVEHLDFVGVDRHAERLGRRHRVRQAPDVVAPQGGAEPFVIRHQEPRAALVAGVALPLPEVDRDRPAELAGVGDLVIPVGPLDQPDRDRRPPLAGPGSRACRSPSASGRYAWATIPTSGQSRNSGSARTERKMA